MGTDNRKLQQEWAKRLKRSGFDDIELPDGSLKRAFYTSDKRRATAYSPVAFDSKRRYFEVAMHLVEEERQYHEARGPKAPLEFQMRVMHADGTSNRAIGRALGINKDKVGLVIQAFAQLIREEILK